MAANMTLAKAFVEVSFKGMDTATRGIADLANAFTPAKNAALGFAQAASPQAFNTFQGSLRILSATIGQAFIPQVIQASKWIQDLARYIANIDPETKKQIGTWVGYGVAVAGAVYAFTQLTRIWDVIAKHPVAATFLAVSAAIMKVNADMDKMIAKMNESVETMQRMKAGVYTEKEFAGSAANAIASDNTLSPEEKLALAQKTKAKLEEEAKAQARAGINQGNIAATADYGKGLLGLTNNTNEQQASIQAKMKEIGMLEDFINKSKQGKDVKFTDPKDIAKSKGGGVNDMLLAGATSGMGGGSGSMTSLESAFSQTAQAALAADEIQQKLLQLAAEGNQTARETATNTQRMSDVLKRMTLP